MNYVQIGQTFHAMSSSHWEWLKTMIWTCLQRNCGISVINDLQYVQTLKKLTSLFCLRNCLRSIFMRGRMIQGLSSWTVTPSSFITLGWLNFLITTTSPRKSCTMPGSKSTSTERGAIFSYSHEFCVLYFWKLAEKIQWYMFILSIDWEWYIFKIATLQSKTKNIQHCIQTAEQHTK